MPVIGMESEFNVWLDEQEINPELYWKHPGTFIDRTLLTREKSSLQLPTGGAVYFDRGVIEVVTPVIELAPSCTARMVRNLWEQIGFVREQLTNWGRQNGHTIRLTAYSSHYNISYEIPRSQQTSRHNIKSLALLLAYILPVPVMVAGGNRRSTGVGVRPRGNRIEVTVDFTPDPGLMIATATLIVGIVREVMWWPSYELSMIDKHGIPIVDGVIPGKHTTRKGWLTKDFHYPQSPYTSDIDATMWTTQFGDRRSLRQMARDTAWTFRKSIRRFSDPFSFRLLFAVLEGRAPSLLDLTDRPAAYEDVGRLCKWGMVIHELKNRETEAKLLEPIQQWRPPLEEHIASRQHAREEKPDLKNAPTRPIPIRPIRPLRPIYLQRRNISLLPQVERRRIPDRRKHAYRIPFPDRRLTRSAYERVFLKLVSGGHLRMGEDVYTPVGMKGWYHAVFRRESDGAERLLSIDQLLRRMRDWF